jgi:hypothetical protein
MTIHNWSLLTLPVAVKPHKVRYYLERRDPQFEPKMAEILCVAHGGANPPREGGAGCGGDASMPGVSR